MDVYSVMGQLLVGWLIADFLSGLLHWVGDSDELGDTSLVQYIAGLNVNHHVDPLAIVRQSFLGRNATQFALVTVIGGTWALLIGPSVVLLGAMIGGYMVGEVHKWAHSPSTANRFVKVLQETGFLQSPKHHAGHHRPPHHIRYCVLTNWVNPVLDALGFWRAFGRLFRKSST